LLSLLTFVGYTALVGFIAYRFTRGEAMDSSDGYFLAGRSLNGWVIAGSLVLTNL